MGTDQPALLRPAGLLFAALLAAGAVQPAAGAKKIAPVASKKPTTRTQKKTSAVSSSAMQAPGGAAANRDLILEALKQRGKPYVWGGASRRGFDCSGFMVYLFKSMRNINLPHSASAQALRGRPVSRDELKPGDLVFFSTYRRGISHVGMFIGENRFIHAANSRKDVRIDTMSGYYQNRFRCARRLLDSPVRFPEKEIEAYMTEPSVTPGD